ncbi:SET and MYND domain-containing protein 4-like isoform X1 [Belonocnema kinseyi]|uniref:SET and MYND domain-containing protein 4-like isoform X1 n=1 Tax=Belonocnema kinseyi TaxID=2817044 RepID=UPI00143D6B02|nr:SET and MYND domain-containing protein 4-like isoform X1 [Belonocnema kinseyi]
MEDNEPLAQQVEINFLSFSVPIPDDYLLETTLRERMVDVPLPKLPFIDKPLVRKSEKDSIEFYKKGEKMLGLGKKNEALKNYSEALRMVPRTSKRVSDYYAARSMAFQKLKMYHESLNDIQRALKLPITEEKKTILLKRLSIIEFLLSSGTLENQKIKKTPHEEVNLSYGENKEVIGVSNAISLEYNNFYGRHFIATRDIKIGDVLMVQSPYMYISNREHGKDIDGKTWFCDNCLNSTMAPVPCDNCTYYLYCSFECRSEAFEKYHKTECKVLNEEVLFGPQSSMFLRLLIVATNHGENFQEVYNLMKKIQTSKDRRTAGFKDGKLDGGNVNAILNLLSHNDKIPRSGLVMNAAKMTAALKKHTDFIKGNHNINDVGRLLMFFSYTCFMNLYSIRRNNFMDAIALGMYPVFNLLNHSCQSNVISYDNKKRQKILRACREIKKGEQIFVAYCGFALVKMTTEERRKCLMETKYFKCQCEACEKNYTYKPELKGKFKVPLDLKKKLLKNPNDAESLWELLRLIFNKYKGPNLEAKAVENALVNALMGDLNYDVIDTFKQLRLL